VERHRLAAMAEARLRQAALALLASGQPGAAVAYASRAVACNPLEEGNHQLLVRSLAASGDRAAIAAGAVQAGIDCLRRACADAAALPDRALQAGALAALGGALVHAVRGRDEEGAAGRPRTGWPGPRPWPRPMSSSRPSSASGA
jgi:Bacterial transcriptional activator domain